jgi:hypothetical protein
MTLVALDTIATMSLLLLLTVGWCGMWLQMYTRVPAVGSAGKPGSFSYAYCSAFVLVLACVSAALLDLVDVTVARLMAGNALAIAELAFLGIFTIHALCLLCSTGVVVDDQGLSIVGFGGKRNTIAWPDVHSLHWRAWYSHLEVSSTKSDNICIPFGLRGSRDLAERIRHHLGNSLSSRASDDLERFARGQLRPFVCLGNGSVLGALQSLGWGAFAGLSLWATGFEVERVASDPAKTIWAEAAMMLLAGGVAGATSFAIAQYHVSRLSSPVVS